MRLTALRTWDLVHKWASLACTLFLLMLCLTGLPLIFHQEIDAALGYRVEPPPVAATAARASLDDIVARAQARRPGDTVQLVTTDAGRPGLWHVRLGASARTEPSALFTYDAGGGEFLGAYPLRQGFMNLMLRLHADMFAGLRGSLFLASMGLLLAASLVSGAVLYGPFMRRLRFGSVRSGHSPRMMWLDLHNLLGVVVLVWLLVVGITGVVNALSVPIFERWQENRPARTGAPLSGPVSAQRALAAARAAEPEMELGFMAFPGHDFAGPRHFTAFMRGTTPWTSRFLKPLLIDAETGAVIDRRELPWYVSILLVSQPLHFGDYGGLPLKILWALLDLVTITVLLSGLYLWMKKREAPLEANLGPGLRLNAWQVWRAPAAIGAIAAIGLASALLGDGPWDVVSWLALSVPAAAIAWHVLKLRG